MHLGRPIRAGLGAVHTRRVVLVSLALETVLKLVDGVEWPAPWGQAAECLEGVSHLVRTPTTVASVTGSSALTQELWRDMVQEKAQRREAGTDDN